MYSQDEKDGMAMKNATIDKFAAKRGCPEGMVDDGRGGCLPKPITVNNNSNYVKGGFGQAANEAIQAEKERKLKSQNAESKKKIK
jgi:hypothetical protein